MAQSGEEVEQRLIELHLSIRGSPRAKAERLFRACIRMVGIADVLWYPKVDENEGSTIYEDEELIMDHTDRESEAARERRGNVATSTDEGEPANLAYQLPIRATAPSAPTSWPQQHPRATTAATYVYQAPPLLLHENTTTQASSRERRSTTTLGREEIRLAGLGTLPTPPVLDYTSSPEASALDQD